MKSRTKTSPSRFRCRKSPLRIRASHITTLWLTTTTISTSASLSRTARRSWIRGSTWTYTALMYRLKGSCSSSSPVLHLLSSTRDTRALTCPHITATLNKALMEAVMISYRKLSRCHPHRRTAVCQGPFTIFTNQIRISSAQESLPMASTNKTWEGASWARQTWQSPASTKGRTPPSKTVTLPILIKERQPPINMNSNNEINRHIMVTRMLKMVMTAEISLRRLPTRFTGFVSTMPRWGTIMQGPWGGCRRHSSKLRPTKGTSHNMTSLSRRTTSISSSKIDSSSSIKKHMERLRISIKVRIKKYV